MSTTTYLVSVYTKRMRFRKNEHIERSDIYDTQTNDLSCTTFNYSLGSSIAKDFVSGIG
jgi:hypothetical protein